MSLRFPTFSSDPTGGNRSDIDLIRPYEPLILPTLRFRFVRQLAESIHKKCDIGPKSRLVLAVSGGADSMAMLAALAAIARKPHRAYELHVAHVHHHLRPQADAEAEMVAAVTESLSLPFHRADVSPGHSIGNLADAARGLRYAALLECCRAIRADALVTGHHGTDQLETVLLNLLRGCGLEGLAGIAWRSEMAGVTIIRPLLDRTHEDCVELCNSVDWPWFEDQSNSDETKARNLLRARVLPVLREIAPDIDERIHRTTELVESASNLLSAIIAAQESTIVHRSPDGAGRALIEIGRSTARSVNRFILSGLLRRLVIESGSSADAVSLPMIEKVINAIEDHHTHVRTFEFPNDVRVDVRHDRLAVYRED